MTAPNVTATVLPSLHRISLPTPFPVGDVNVYLAEGEPLTLIDCGVRTEISRQTLEAGLDSLGYGLADIERLVITHHHTDHLGLAGQIVEVSGCEVWAHLLAVRWLERPAEARENLRVFSGALFRTTGVPETDIIRADHIGRVLESMVGTAEVTRTIDEGDTLTLGGCEWQVYHTPGHAGDLLCFYQPESRVLLSSDHILRDVSSNPLIEAPDAPGGERPRRLLDYLRELERMATLDIAIAYGGHGDAVNNVRQLVPERLTLHANRAEKLYGLLYEAPRTAYALGKVMFPRAREAELYLVMSEVIGHLDILVRDNRAGADCRDGVEWWHAE